MASRRKPSFAVLLLACLAAGAAGQASPGGATVSRAEGIERVLAAAFPEGRAGAPPGGREQFLAVLGSELFAHEATGPFDVYVEKADGQKKGLEAKKRLGRVVEGLAPLLPVMKERFGRPSGAVSGRRFPVVLCDARRDKGETSYEDLLALLDQCEDQGFSGWKPDLPIFDERTRAASVAHNWDVVIFNCGHPDIAQAEKPWLDHGLGYAVINHVLNRLFAKGAWGPPPPWLRQGLLDELDIEAFGSAWIAAGESSSWSSHSAGWKREGWSGFLPEGQAPPPPVTGPPPNLSKGFESKVDSDSWLTRSESGTRHWTALANDRKSESAASLCAMAAAQSYGPRDRAYARCVLHLLLEIAPQGDLLAALDRESGIARTGMRDAEPLPLVTATALGGLPEMDKLAAYTLQQVLVAAGRDDVVKRIRELGAADLLGLADHRAQADWLWTQHQFDDHARQSLYGFIVQAENYHELGEWEVIGQALDRATSAALAVSGTYPKAEDKRRGAADAFKAALKPEVPAKPWGVAFPRGAGGR